MRHTSPCPHGRLAQVCPECGQDAATQLDGTGTHPEQTFSPPGAPQGDLVPGYTIERELGRGGMGVVYMARHLALKRIVALKLLRSGSHPEPHELARFKAEAEAVARLQHPNIVQV